MRESAQFNSIRAESHQESLERKREEAIIPGEDGAHSSPSQHVRLPYEGQFFLEDSELSPTVMI